MIACSRRVGMGNKVHWLARRAISVEIIRKTGISKPIGRKFDRLVVI